MKNKTFKAVFAMALAIALLSATVFAFADSGISNRIIGEPGVQTVGTSSPSGAELIRRTGDQGKIVMPRYQSYFEHPAPYYVNAPKKHSIYVYKNPNIVRGKDSAQEDIMPFALEGLKVLIVAQQNGMSCIVYTDDKFQQHAGWVETKHLSGRFPGKETVIGTASAGAAAEGEVPAMAWSKGPFVGTNHKYAYFADPIRNCVQFKLAYQVTNAYDCRFDDTLGTRTIYVNDGNGWREAGQFEYNAQGTVLVTVNLREAMNLKAVAVIPSCNNPDSFLYRVEIQDACSTDFTGK